MWVYFIHKLNQEAFVAHEWQKLTELTGAKPFVVSRVTLKESGIAIDGEFELPPLARLSYDDQVFIAEFIRGHGSIKQMEQAFGVSYPTIKNRLNRIAEQLQLVQVTTTTNRDEVLDQLERGEISAREAAERLKQ
jgi:hypothetical protein